MLWDDWRGGRVAGSAPARRIVHADGLWLVVCWQPTVSGARALLAAPRFVEAEWLGPVLQLAADQHVAVALGDPMRQAVDLQGLEPWPASDARRGDAAVVRGHLQAELPWNVLVRSRAGIEDDAVRSRWRLLGAGFLLLVLIAGAASALVIRAVTRELAVARLQSDFVAAVSHEFRTPLTTLRQFTEMLREQPHLPEPRRVLCYDAQARATDRLTRLVESVLDFGRLEAGAERYHIQPTDGADLVGRITAEFRSESQGSGHEIVFVPDGATPIECDRHALGRAVRNLLDNATKYSPEKTRIDVTVRHAGTSVQIAVRDRGLGIPPHEHGAIFAKFQRGGEARMRGIRGTGLGLAMVRQIVEAHGGRVDVASRPGEGSTFTIVLPAAGPSLEIAGAQIGEGSPAQT